MHTNFDGFLINNKGDINIFSKILLLKFDIFHKIYVFLCPFYAMYVSLLAGTCKQKKIEKKEEEARITWVCLKH